MTAGNGRCLERLGAAFPLPPFVLSEERSTELYQRVGWVVEHAEEHGYLGGRDFELGVLAGEASFDAVREGEVDVASDAHEEVDDRAAVCSGHIDADDSHRPRISRRAP